VSRFLGYFFLQELRSGLYISIEKCPGISVKRKKYGKTRLDLDCAVGEAIFD
jgi:hypothetical protein